MKEIFIIYLIIANAVGFFVMKMDKERAKAKAWRIPEKVLFGIAILGGSIGTWVGMYIFHHKTKHWYFRIGMPIIAIVQVVLLGMV